MPCRLLPIRQWPQNNIICHHASQVQSYHEAIGGLITTLDTYDMIFSQPMTYLNFLWHFQIAYTPSLHTVSLSFIFELP